MSLHCSSTLRVESELPASRERQRPDHNAARNAPRGCHCWLAQQCNGRTRSPLLDKTSSGTHRPGTSLVEVVISAMLIGVVLVAALDSVGSAVLATRVSGNQLDAQLLAESLMNEILATAYEDPDTSVPVVFGIESDEPAAPTNRAAFDDIDDYDDWSETPPNDRNGVALTGLDAWSRSVNIQKLTFDDPSLALGDAAADQGVKKITVTVTSPEGTVTEIAAMRGKYGSVEQQAGVAVEVVTDVTITLDLAGQVLTTNALILNHAKD